MLCLRASNLCFQAIKFRLCNLQQFLIKVNVIFNLNIKISANNFPTFQQPFNLKFSCPKHPIFFPGNWKLLLSPLECKILI